MPMVMWQSWCLPLGLLSDRGSRAVFLGADTKNYQSPDLLDFPLFTLFGQEFSAYRGFMITISVGIFLALYYVLTRSRIGIIIQAAITHPHTVANLGHNVPLIFMAVFGVGTALAGVAGVIAGPVLTTFPGMAVVWAASYL